MFSLWIGIVLTIEEGGPPGSEDVLWTEDHDQWTNLSTILKPGLYHKQSIFRFWVSFVLACASQFWWHLVNGHQLKHMVLGPIVFSSHVEDADAGIIQRWMLIFVINTEWLYFYCLVDTSHLDSILNDIGPETSHISKVQADSNYFYGSNILSISTKM